MRKHNTIFAVRRSFAKRVAGPLFCVLVMFYLGFHMVSGERGVFALIKASHTLEALKAELVEVTARRQALEGRVSLLASNSLDLDMLDERARSVLGLTGKDEVVIFLPDSQ